MKRLILALMLSSLAVPPVQAQPVVIQHWDSGQLVDALQSLGATDIKVSAMGGRPAITARTRDGLNVGLYAKACDPAVGDLPPSCHAIEGVISFDVSQRSDRALLVDQLNHRFALGKFMAEPDGMLRASRYFLLDGGITPENLKSELTGYFAVGVLAGQTIWPPAQQR